MPMSHFPHGFRNRVSIKHLPIDVVNSGRVYWVDNSTSKKEPGVSVGVNAGPGTFNQPFSTIAYAISVIASDASNASRGDVIYVKSGHAETIDSAADIAISVAGLKIIGLGQGHNKPVLTFASSTAATITMAGANSALKNFKLLCNIDGLVSAIVVSAAGVEIDVDTYDTSSAVEAAGWILTTAAADNLKIKIKHKGFIAGNAGLTLIDLVGVNEADIDVDFYGIVATAVVNMSTTACDAIRVNANIHNGTTALTKNVVDTVTGSKWIATGYDGVGGYRYVGGSGAALAALTSASTAGLGTDGTTVTDSATTVLGAIGADTANNEFASTSVVANRDGSVLERLEALMDPLGGYDPLLGFRVTKVSNLADGAGTDALFTVTGRCLITSLTGEVTTIIGGAATLKITDTTNSIDLCAATTIDTDAVGTMYALSGVKADVLNGGIAPVVGSVSYANGAYVMPIVVGDAQAALTLAQVLDAADTGAVTWSLYYKPLVSGATVAAAA